MADTLIPEILDSRKVFAREATVTGVLPVSRLERFTTYLSDDSGQITVNLRFYLDEQHRKRVDGEIKTTVNVMCQRCLEPMPVNLTDQVDLAVVVSEAQARALPAELDPWLNSESELSLIDILEEQLILRLPIVNMHADEKCNAAAIAATEQQNSEAEKADDESGGKPNPFAILQTLKKK